MPKNLFQDMVKVKNKSGEPAKDREAREIREWREAQERRVSNEAREPKVANRGNGRGRSRFMLWLVAAGCFVFFLFALSYFFSKATVTVNPKSQDVVLDQNFSVSRETAEENLSFDLAIISGEESGTVGANGEKDVTLRAKGVAVIYNNFSAVSQRLDIDTRLEGSNGKIYKTEIPISVPGKSANGTPGSVEAKIYASEAGEAYNSAPLDFTIVGFKGTPKYTKFYGRSKGPITGGFTGKTAVIDDAEKAKAIEEMKAALKTKLFQRVSDQIPAGFVLFENAVILSLTDNNFDLAKAENGKLPLKLSGTLYAILFDEAKLTEKIAKENLVSYDGSPVFIPNIRELAFTLPMQAGFSNFSEVKNLNFNLSGPAKIVWKFDPEKLTAELLGKSKEDFNQILSQYPNVESAEVALSPFWRKSFPDAMKNIKIIINYPQ